MGPRNIFELFVMLPKPIQDNIKNEMTFDNLRTLRQVSKMGCVLFPISLSKKLLSHVMRREYHHTVALLNANPSNVFVKLREDDPVGNHFEKISPLQYAAWAWDTKTVQTMLNFNPSPEAIKQAIDQLDEIEKIRTQASLFNLVTLIYFFQERKANIAIWNEVERTTHWSEKIGQMQRKMPVSILMAISEEIQNKSVIPISERIQNKSAIPIVYHWNARTGLWSGSSPVFGLTRAFRIDNGVLLASNGEMKEVTGEIDLNVLMPIAQEKQQELDAIKERLKSSLSQLNISKMDGC